MPNVDSYATIDPVSSWVVRGQRRALSFNERETMGAKNCIHPLWPLWIDLIDLYQKALQPSICNCAPGAPPQTEF
jgi:hypothetical protein